MDLKLNKLSKILGLEILNLDLKKVIDKNLKIKLNDLFVENKVLVVRKQFMVIMICPKRNFLLAKYANTSIYLKSNIKITW